MGKRLNDITARVRIALRSHAYQQSQNKSDAYKQLFGDASDERVLPRLQAIAPCLGAQLSAADDGDFRHTSSGLVPANVQVLGAVAKHNFEVDFEGVTPAQARRLQRGHRVWPPFPFAAIECSALEAKLRPTPVFQWDAAAAPFVPFQGDHRSLDKAVCESVLYHLDSCLNQVSQRQQRTSTSITITSCSP